MSGNGAIGNAQVLLTLVVVLLLVNQNLRRAQWVIDRATSINPNAHLELASSQMANA